MRVLLDTHVILHLLLGARTAVPDDVVRTLAASDTVPLVSAASVWEIAIKRSLGKLEIDKQWQTELMSLDLEHVPITAEHAAGVESLPWHHRDPFDRLLVAQAQVERATLVTSDPQMGVYGVVTWWGD